MSEVVRYIVFVIMITVGAALSAAESVSCSQTLPVLYIETENRAEITSKTEYVQAHYWLDTTWCGELESIGSEQEPLSMQIRGRGHSSWKSAKKPYKIKLATKQEVMGMAGSKHWALLKPTENTVAGLKLGRLLDMAWTPEFRPVEVVLNGDYIGLYFLTETIRIDEDRIDIFKQKDQETDPELISGGWLVEIDNYRDVCQITVPESRQWNMTLRYHSPEDLSAEQSDWLTDEFKAINSAIYSTDKTSREWEQYIDVESMARFFIIQEVMDNPDGFHGSFYLHKDLGPDARWVAGPIWDLVCYNREKTDYTFKMKVHYNITPHWIGEIIQYDNFCKSVGKVWDEVYPDRLSEIYDYIDETVLPLDLAWQHDCARWNDDASQTAQLRTDRIKTALSRNIEWFNDHIPSSPHSGIQEMSAADRSVTVHNLQGIFVGKYSTEAEALSALRNGIYIVNGRKVRVN